MSIESDNRGNSREVIRRDGIDKAPLPLKERDLPLDEQLIARGFEPAKEKELSLLDEIIAEKYPVLHQFILELEENIGKLNEVLGVNFEVRVDYFYYLSDETGKREIAVRLEVKDPVEGFLLPDTLRSLSFPEDKQEVIEQREQSHLSIGQNGNVLYDGIRSFEVFASPVQMIIKPENGQRLVGVQFSLEAAQSAFSRISEKVENEEKEGGGFTYLYDVELQRGLQELAKKVFPEALVDSFEDHIVKSTANTESPLFCQAVVSFNCGVHDAREKSIMMSYENPGSPDGGLKLVLRPF